MPAPDPEEEEEQEEYIGAVEEEERDPAEPLRVADELTRDKI